IRPEVVVCMGVTAANAVLQKRVTITASRGNALESPDGFRTFVTVHPSAILRIPDRRDREAERRRFVQDLQRAARAR
ncbi:MAG TPA: uracil-DNA glycosylase family protein, partial [Methylomirabilota bacterium]